MKELVSFFEFDLINNKPCVILVPDRKTINQLKGRDTEDWLVGWADRNKIFLLNRENYESESSHKYSDDTYRALLKHELAHCFSNVIGETNKPIWLLEGVSIFVSGQLKRKKKPEKLSKFIDFYETSGKGIYDESGFAVEFLVKEYGKEKLFALMKRMKDADTKEEFASLFKSIYGFELNYENFKLF